MSSFFRCTIPVLLLLLLGMLPVYGAASEVNQEKEKNKGFHGQVSEMVLDTADAIDRFFGDERYYTHEVNRSRIRVFLDTDAIEDHGVEFNPRLKIHLVLPRLKNRFRLVFNDEEDERAAHVREDIEDEANLALPIFQAHGALDPMVPVQSGERARDRLLELGYPLTWKTYPMGHEVHPEEIRAVGSLLNEWLIRPKLTRLV